MISADREIREPSQLRAHYFPGLLWRLVQPIALLLASDEAQSLRVPFACASLQRHLSFRSQF